MENKYSEDFGTKINKAIKVSQDYAKKVNGKLSYVARVLPSAYKPKGTGKWARVYLSTKTTKELKKLRNEYAKLNMKLQDEVATKYDVDKMNIACIDFAIKFKEIAREALASKVNAEVAERADWDEFLENIDLIGLQISEESEYFTSLGRYNYGKRKRKNRTQNATQFIAPKKAPKVAEAEK